VITRTPYLACSTRRPSHHAARPALVAPYTARPGRVANAQWLVTVITRPVKTFKHQWVVFVLCQLHWVKLTGLLIDGEGGGRGESKTVSRQCLKVSLESSTIKHLRKHSWFSQKSYGYLFSTSHVVAFVANVATFCTSYQVSSFPGIFGTGSLAAMTELYVSWPLWITHSCLQLKLIVLSVDLLICNHLHMRFNLWM
jgi:hypothetical protein